MPVACVLVWAVGVPPVQVMYEFVWVVWEASLSAGVEPLHPAHRDSHHQCVCVYLFLVFWEGGGGGGSRSGGESFIRRNIPGPALVLSGFTGAVAMETTLHACNTI